MADPTVTAAGEVAVIVKSGGVPKVKEAVVEWLNEPLVALIVIVYTFCVAELHDRDAVKDPDTLVGAIDPHVRPLGTVSVRLTVPENPFREATVMVETAEDPVLTAAGDDAATVKSWKLNVIVAVWTIDPPVPVTVSV